MQENKTLLRSVLVVLLVAAVAFTGYFIFARGHSGGQKDEPVQPATQDSVQVPYLVHKDDADALQLLNNAGLYQGKVDYEYSDTVAQGLVISQNPKALTWVKEGTRVDIVVSKGKKTPEKVTMPNVVGLTQDDAEKAIKGAGLVPVPGNPEFSDTVNPGLVCKQSVPAGTQLTEGSNVTFAISMGKKTVKVPDTTGKSMDEARAALTAAGLGVDSTSEYSAKVAKDVVIKQSVAAGTEVTEGTTVTITVSLGQKPVDKVKVPDVMTYKLSDAQKALASAGLKCAYSGDAEGTVSAISPAAGTEVEVGSTVSITLQHVTTLVAVPDVAGMNGPAARAACESVGLTIDYDVRQPDRILIGSEPEAGTLVDIGTIIEARYEDPKPITVEVPDVAGLTGPEADDALEAVGLDLDYNVRQPDDVLAGTDPAAGTEVEVGTMVEAVYPDPQIEPMGAWEVADGAQSLVSDDERAVFDEAGLDVEPIVVLAKQVEELEPDEPSEPSEESTDSLGAEASDEESAGPLEVVTYAFLCTSADGWSVATIKVDEAGAVALLGTRDVDVTALNTFDGGSYDDWQVPDAPETMLSPEQAQVAFDNAYEGYVGVAFRPIATMATQVVSGENYLVMATGSSPDNPVNLVYALTIYEDTEGNAMFADVERVDLASYLSL